MVKSCLWASSLKKKLRAKGLRKNIHRSNGFTPAVVAAASSSSSPPGTHTPVDGSGFHHFFGFMTPLDDDGDDDDDDGGDDDGGDGDDDGDDGDDEAWPFPAPPTPALSAVA
jgi:hypothetical protein